MTVLIAQMEAEGWVKRRTDARDARAKLVAITPKGRRELESAGRVLRRRLGAELEALAPREVEAIAASLEPLVRSVMHRIASAPEGDRAIR